MQAKEFDNFRKKFVFKIVKITRKVAFTDQEAAENPQVPLRKSLGRKNICLNRFLVRQKCPILRGKYDKPRQHIKKQTHHFADKVCLVKAMVFPVVLYRCES